MCRRGTQGTLFGLEGLAMNMVKKSAPMRAGPAVALPVHEQVYQDLRARILFGEIAPGQAVTR